MEEVLEEDSTYGGGGGQAGTFAYAQVAGQKTWAPQSPPFRHMTGGDHDVNIKTIADDDAEFAATAGRRKPYPLETIDDHLAQAYIYVKNAEEQIKNCIKYNAIMITNKEKKALLSHLERKIKGVMEMIKSISADLDRISIT